MKPGRGARDETQRFSEKVDKSGECWLWTGTTRLGYGQLVVRRDGRWVHRDAHRLAWEMHFGPIPSGLLVCHHCDTPLCVRPEHLFLGTPADNMRDMIAKGRQGDHRNFGERNGRAKLTTANVEDIRRRYAAGGVSQLALGAEYHVNQTMIGFIVRGASWRSVDQ